MGLDRKRQLALTALTQQYRLMRVTLLGDPGTGKTTLGQRLESAGIGAYISGSALLDEHIRSRAPGWEEIKARKDRGERADPALTHELLRQYIARVPSELTIVLDGFPKSFAEVELTEKRLGGGGIDHAVLLRCSTTVCTARIIRRLVCDNCRWVTTGDPSQPCPQGDCIGKLRKRGDDRPEVLAERRTQEPIELLADYFSKRKRLEVVNAELGADEVFAEVSGLIYSWRSAHQDTDA